MEMSGLFYSNHSKIDNKRCAVFSFGAPVSIQQDARFDTVY
jgi:hypothetical protein